MYMCFLESLFINFVFYVINTYSSPKNVLIIQEFSPIEALSSFFAAEPTGVAHRSTGPRCALYRCEFVLL